MNALLEKIWQTILTNPIATEKAAVSALSAVTVLWLTISGGDISHASDLSNKIDKAATGAISAFSGIYAFLSVVHFKRGPSKTTKPE